MCFLKEKRKLNAYINIDFYCSSLLLGYCVNKHYIYVDIEGIYFVFFSTYLVIKYEFFAKIVVRSSERHSDREKNQYFFP